MKGTFSLVKAVDAIARTQPDLDMSVEALIDAMNTSSQLAKQHVPLSGRRPLYDLIFGNTLREIIRGANIIKVYCKKPIGAHVINYARSAN